jgi:uncharacterized Zn finger protein
MSIIEVSKIQCSECGEYLVIEEGLLRCLKCGRTFSYPRELDPPRLHPEEKRE